MKVKNKNDFFYLSEVWKTVKCQGKIREKSGNFEMNESFHFWLCFVAQTGKILHSIEFLFHLCFTYKGSYTSGLFI